MVGIRGREIGLVLLAMLGVALPLRTAAEEPRPGIYIRSGASGTLTLSRDQTGALKFELATVGRNCHTCEANGVVKGRVAIAEDPEAGSMGECRLDLNVQDQRIQLNSKTYEACISYCGARAGLTGIYQAPIESCEPTAVRQRRDQFLKLYRAKRFEAAVVEAEHLVTQCGEFIHWFEMDDIRNDLALAQYRAGKPQACLQTLSLTEAGKVRDETELREALPPCEFDSYSPQAAPIWHNRKLCEAASNKSKSVR